ncbi:MAG: hypothetical protein LBR33_06385 [Propionibacteriaceae bacterium]|jgi:hypothetical protein|nr:hypothetical protein [Propionibacteriaceae bacterium]
MSVAWSAPVPFAASVPAAPFRAYVLHLLEASEVPWRVLAQEAGVPAAALRTLVTGRDGAFRPRLDRTIAQRLLAVTPGRLRSLHAATVPSTRAQQRIAELRRRGLDGPAIGRLLGVDADTLRRIEEGFQSTCSLLVDARARAAVTALREAGGWGER